MAKSARASSKKHNKTTLRHRVHAPVEQARAERLSSKLLALVSQPKAGQEDEMEIENDKNKQQEQTAGETNVEDTSMEIDGEEKKAGRKGVQKKVARVQKRRRGKATSTITFPKYEKGRRVPSGKKTKAKR